MSGAWMEAEREASRRWFHDLSKAANPDCLACRGKGTTRGWVAQGYVTYACSCTGMADWQIARAASKPAVAQAQPPEGGDESDA